MNTTLQRFHRSFRHHPITERARMRLRGRASILLPEVGLEVAAGPGDIVIDCGANVGDITSRMARTGATVHAFEPNPRVFTVLQRRFRGVPSVHCHQAGVMAHDSELTLRVPVAYGSFDALQATVAGSFLQGSNTDLAIETTQVPCVGLAGFIASLQSRVRLLKIDIEGAEIEVIHSLLDSGCIDRIDQIVVETHEKQMPELLAGTEALRQRIEGAGLASKVRLDWV